MKASQEKIINSKYFAPKEVVIKAKNRIAAGEMDKAERLITEGLHLHPESLLLFGFYVTQLIHWKKYLRAFEVISKGLEKFPDNFRFQFIKAKLFYLTDDYDSALKILTEINGKSKFDSEVEYLIEKINLRNGVSIYDQDGLKTINNHDFITATEFAKAYDRGLKATRNKDYKWHWRVHIGLWAARYASSLEGDFVECGVNRGFQASAIMEALSWNKLDKNYYLIDTYEGIDLALVTEEEKNSGIAEKNAKLLQNGFYTAEVESVIDNFKEWPTAKIVVGSIPEILPTVPATRVCYLHIDLNCAQPEVDAISFFWDKLVTGGVVLLDDYGGFGFEHQKMAMDEFAKQNGLSIASLPTGQGIIIK